MADKLSVITYYHCLAAPTTTTPPVCPSGSLACPGINEVNNARDGHSTPQVNFDPTLTADAQAWADQLFANGVDPTGTSYRIYIRSC